MSAELMADELTRHGRSFDFPRRVTLVAENLNFLGEEWSTVRLFNQESQAKQIEDS